MAITAVAKIWNRVDAGDGQTRLEWTAPYQDDKGNRLNEEWYKYTPAITLHITVKNEIAEKFKDRTEYLLTFEEK